MSDIMQIKILTRTILYNTWCKVDGGILGYKYFLIKGGIMEE